MKFPLRLLAAPIVLASACPLAFAQLIEDIEIRREGSNAIASVRFVTAIQFQRFTTSRAGDLGQAFYDVLPSRQTLSLVSGQRRVPGAGSIPEIEVTDEPVGKANLSRKLIIRFSAPTRFRIRAGRGNRSIEVVMEGLGDSVRLAAVTAPVSAAPPQQNYIVTLQSSAEPGHNLQASVPARLQQYQTFTSRRTVDGRTLYDINLGYFGTLADAEAAREILISRFPQATIAALQAPAGTDSAPGSAPAEVEANAANLLAVAQAAYDRGDFPASLDPLGQLLNLPPNTSSRRAQELIGLSRLKLGDTARARAEFEAFLNLYPTGADSDRLRDVLATVPAAPPTAAAAPPPPPASNWSGSVSTFFFGGKSKVRSQDFLDSPISGLPELQGENTISGTDQKQVQTNVDLNWRHRDAEADQRFVFRDSYTADLLPNGRNRNRLSALYYDHKSFTNGTSFRVGRQSPTGGGVLYRFDGLQAGYTFRPKWKANAVFGAPTDDLLQTRRRLYGAWIDAEALTNEISGSLYFNQQTIDSEVDRRAVGTELRYFSGGVSLSAQFDYDVVLKGLNIASLQGTWQLPDTTVFNFLYDRRTTPLLSLGNTLFFQNPALVTPAQRIQDLLTTSSISQLREQVKGITAYQTQGLVGVTTPLAKNWQIGADIRLTNVGEVRPVPIILPNGQASTGNQWSVGGQLIGTNLYSQRDTHVFSATLLKSPTYSGYLLSYNNLTTIGEGWQIEPSLRFSHQNENTGARTVRWAPGLRVTYKLMQQVSLESELSYERSKRTSSVQNETSDRLFYYLGARYDF